MAYRFLYVYICNITVFCENKTNLDLDHCRDLGHIHQPDISAGNLQNGGRLKFKKRSKWYNLPIKGYKL